MRTTRALAGLHRISKQCCAARGSPPHLEAPPPAMQRGGRLMRTLGALARSGARTDRPSALGLQQRVLLFAAEHGRGGGRGAHHALARRTVVAGVQLHRLCAGVALHRRRRVGVAEHQDVLAACAATGECAPARSPGGASAPQRAPRWHRRAPEGRGTHHGWGPGKSRAGADTPRSPPRAPARSGCHQSAMAGAPPRSAACCPARATCCAGWSLRPGSTRHHASTPVLACIPPRKSSRKRARHRPTTAASTSAGHGPAVGPHRCRRPTDILRGCAPWWTTPRNAGPAPRCSPPACLPVLAHGTRRPWCVLRGGVSAGARGVPCEHPFQRPFAYRPSRRYAGRVTWR